MLNLEGLLVDRLEGVRDVIANWHFLHEGLIELNSIVPENRHFSSASFLKLLCNTVDSGEKSGYVMIVRSKNNKPLFYLVAYDNSDEYHEASTVFIVAFYSNGKSKTASRFGLEALKKWARGHGYKELQGESSRINGSSFRYFEKYLGFRRCRVLFTQEI